jgi:ferredoxin-NADP reductase
MKAAFVRYEWENKARTIASFYFKPHGRYRYEAGQYAVMSIPHPNPDNRGTSRTMTFSSSPHEELLKITMKIYGPDGRDGSSYKRALLQLKQDEEVTIYDALGDMVLPLNTDIPLVFVAGGVGIASFTGIMSWLNHSGETRAITLHYAVRESDDIVMQEDFESYPGLERHIYLPGSTEKKSAPGITPRRLMTDDILQSCKSDTQIYLSGTESMVEQFRAGLRAAGIANTQIAFDYFDGYTEL